MKWPQNLLLHVGDVWTLRVAGHSAGGYRWSADVEPPGAASASVTPTAEDTSLGSRDELVTIRGTESGRATVAVTLSRSWEPEPIERHTIEVNVEPSSDTTR